MEGINQITNKIITDAELKAKEIKESADKIILENVTKANEWVKEYLLAQNKILDNDVKEIVSRRLTVADLDVRKIVLEAKSKVIEKSFEIALEKLCALPKEQYLGLVKKLIEENAEEGDVVMLSSDNVISEEDVKKLEVYKAKKLTVSKDKITEKGGVVLIGVSCDKTLTFRSVLENEKSNLTSSIALKLFGDN